VIPERACGPFRHAADLSGLRIYDFKRDPKGLKDKSHWCERSYRAGEPFADRASALEMLVVAAGFDGYLADFGQCDAVVLLGKRTIDVKHSPKG
jgi:hypothetical protein